MFYAAVNGVKRLPAPGDVGVCPMCGRAVLAKCGLLKTWHWAHRVRAACDPWAEPVGPWHRGWQALVRPECAEVALGLHRADIVGNRGVVVELQHSPITAAEILARERYYGRMVWLFEARTRFRAVISGTRAFFALGKNKHIAMCEEPVWLDFGDFLIEVEAFTDIFAGCSGFGRVRARTWFIDTHLSESLANAPPLAAIAAGPIAPVRDVPGQAIGYTTRWHEPETGRSWP